MTEQLPTHLIRPLPAYLDKERVQHFAHSPSDDLRAFVLHCRQRYATASRDERHDLDRDIEHAHWVLAERMPAAKLLTGERVAAEIAEQDVRVLRKQLAEAEARLVAHLAAVALLEERDAAEALAEAEVAAAAREVAA